MLLMIIRLPLCRRAFTLIVCISFFLFFLCVWCFVAFASLIQNTQCLLCCFRYVVAAGGEEDLCNVQSWHALTLAAPARAVYNFGLSVFPVS